MDKNTNNFMQNMMQKSEQVNPNTSNTTQTKSTDAHKNHTHARFSVHRTTQNSDVNNLPWSCTFGLGNISKLDALKFIYHCKNRNEALSLVMNHNETIDQLVADKHAQSQFHMMQQVFLMRHKEQALKHYVKFHHNDKNK